MSKNSGRITLDLLDNIQRSASHIEALCLIAAERNFKPGPEMDSIVYFIEQQAQTIGAALDNAERLPEVLQ